MQRPVPEQKEEPVICPSCGTESKDGGTCLLYTSVFASGVAALENNNLLPLTAIFIEPAKVLFLNNAIGQGILTPLGTAQLNELGKSVLFLLESNPGPGLGILLAYCCLLYTSTGNQEKTGRYGGELCEGSGV